MTLWQEGDIVGPTNLNARGGSGFLQWLNVKDYGAVGDGTTDDYTALQAALNAANTSATMSGAKTVYVPPGSYRHSKPLQIGKSGVRLIGSSQGVNSLVSPSELKPTFQYGFGLAVVDNSATIPGLGTALATGTGSSWVGSGPGLPQRWFNLRDAASLDVNGLTAFAVECYYKPAGSDLSSSRNIVGSNGRFFNFETTSNSFSLRTNASNGISFVITTTAGTKTLSGGAMVNGTIYHVAGTWDGATARLFINGTQITSQALAGTLVQAVAEDVTLGSGVAFSPEQTFLYDPTEGPMDSVRISNTARYTAGFTAPTAKFVLDGSTLILVNFDLQQGPFTRAQTKDGDAWLFHREISSSLVGCNGWEVSGITLSGPSQNSTSGLVWGANCNEGKISRLYMQNMRNGLYGGLRDAYMAQFSDVHIDATNGRYGFMAHGNNALHLQCDTFRLFGGAVCLFSAGQYNNFKNAFVQTDGNSSYGAIFKATSWEFQGFITTEAGGGTNFQAAFATGKGGVQVNTSGKLTDTTLESANSKPPILVDTVDSVTVDTCTFQGLGTATSLMQSKGTHKRPIVFVNPAQLTTTLPLSDVAGTATLVLPGVQVVNFTGTPAFNAQNYSEFNFTLAGLQASSTLTHLTPGQPIDFVIRQDGVGGYAFTWPTNVLGGMSVNTAPNVVSAQRFAADSFSTNPNAYAISSGATSLGPTQFSPANIAGLKIWLQSDKITGLSDGSSLQTWTDLSGNGNHFVQPSAASQPLYKTLVLNGQPAVRFDGVSSILTFLSASTISTPYSTVFVARPISEPTGLNDILLSWDRTFAYNGRSADPGNWQAASNGQVIQAGIGALGVGGVVTSVFTGAGSLIQLNGSAATGSLDTWSAKNMALGAASTFTRFNNSDLFLVLFYASQLTAGDIANLEAYANSKYSLF